MRGLIWVDMVWPWVIAYDLWNHAFLYNSLADYTWYCTLALLLVDIQPLRYNINYLHLSILLPSEDNNKF